MRYIPHTEEEISEMLSVVGAKNLDEIFSSIPKDARLKNGLNLPAALAEQELLKNLRDIGEKNLTLTNCLSFLGGGSYHHHVPSAVSELIARSEWVTPYTPYQPEISQGTLQAIFEYQTMICNLTGMEVSNASHYDGATATAEAALMAINKTGRKNIVVSGTLHPEYKATIKTLLAPKSYGLIEVSYSSSGQVDISSLKDLINNDTAGVIIQSPNFFGVIEDLEVLSEVIHNAGAFFVVAVTEPISLGILKGPGEFGADVVVAEGQSFGSPPLFGGPGLGIFASREKYLRSMPGRIVGATADSDGKRGFVLTMSTREQHIRREKATSNICSNEALVALNAAIYLALLGKSGLKKLAESNLSNAEYLKRELSKIKGITIPFSGPTFNEFVIKFDRDVNSLCKTLLNKKIFAGIPLERRYKELGDHLLVCTTECHSKEDMDNFVATIKSEYQRG